MEELHSLIKNRLNEALSKRLNQAPQSEQPSQVLNESDEGLKLIGFAKSFGAKDVELESGVLVADFEHRDALNDFTNALEDLEYVDSYEIRVEGESDEEADAVDFDSLPSEVKAVVIVYVAEDYIDYGEYEIEVDDEEAPDVDDSAGELTEVKRRIKVNFRGKKRIKMQCKPGFKWEAANRTCVKIGGAELAKNRKSHRRAILTKRSMGTAFKKRVLKKTKKARRYRSALGLK